MSKEFYSDGTIVIRVEANDKNEAREIIISLIEETMASLPTGVSFSIGQHHQTREIGVFVA